MTKPKSAPRRRPGRPSGSDALWAAVRRDYLGGLSAVDCCRRYGVRMSTLRDRAARGRWRRIDQPWVPHNQLASDDEGVMLDEQTGGDLDRIEMRELSFIAHRRMMRAALRGDAAEALRWRRVRLAMDEEEAETQRFLSQQEHLRHQRDGDPDSPDSPDSISSPDCGVGRLPSPGPRAAEPGSPTAAIHGSVAV